ncbi:unnamed protein product [Gongylonema pulchrum]|uniref:Helitron_like_N domain-containing protein n=1 Tax=Gongylonema pulchrum TaxID=637853 RepID=A0A183CUG0_9BILA|nr:unnamed protein product [Gongylonema pulchrum]
MENYHKVKNDIREYVRQNNLGTSTLWITLPQWYKFQEYLADYCFVGRFLGQLSIKIENGEPVHFLPCRYKQMRYRSPNHVLCNDPSHTRSGRST